MNSSTVDYIQLGRRVAEKRKSQQLTQEQLGELAGLSNSYISDIENAKGIPSIDTIVKIAYYTGTTPDYLIIGLDDGVDDVIMNDLVTRLKWRSDKEKRIALSIVSALLDELG